jgi:hypothetical protein
VMSTVPPPTVTRLPSASTALRVATATARVALPPPGLVPLRSMAPRMLATTTMPGPSRLTAPTSTPARAPPTTP